MDPVVLFDGGWMAVPYEGPDTVVVEVGIGRAPDAVVWAPAFLDYWAGIRVARILQPQDVAPRSWVWLRYGGVTYRVERFQA